MIRKLIRTDGTEVDLLGPISNADICTLINADTLDVVALHHLGDPLHVMAVDDGGYETEVIEHGNGRIELRPTRARKPVNNKATALYWANCQPGITHRIVGDVVIVPDSDYA